MRASGVLQGGHGPDIVVERVDKVTDNGTALLLCCAVADADSPGDWPVVGPGASPRPSAPWPTTMTRPQSRKQHREGMRVAHGGPTVRAGYAAVAVRQSRGRKMAINTSIAGGLQSAHVMNRFASEEMLKGAPP